MKYTKEEKTDIQIFNDAIKEHRTRARLYFAMTMEGKTLSAIRKEFNANYLFEGENEFYDKNFINSIKIIIYSSAIKTVMKVLDERVAQRTRASDF